MLKVRLARAGAKKRPYYHIVVTDSRNPRDGRFLEKVGSYNPMLAKDAENRVVLNGERIAHWISKGAQVTERVALFLGKAGLAPMPARPDRPEKSKVGAKMTERAREKAERLEKAAEAVAAAKEEAPAAEAAAVEEAAVEAPAEAPAEAEAPAAEEKTEG